MSIETIIIGIGILVGLLHFGITKPMVVRGVLIGLTITTFLLFIGISFLWANLFTTIGLICFGILSLIYSVYSGIKKNWRNFIIAFFSFAVFLFELLAWGYAMEVKISMLIPIIVYVTLLVQWKNYKTEFSVITIFAAYQFGPILTLIQYWIDS